MMIWIPSSGVGDVLSPIMTDLDAAPENLLQFIRCKCKLTSKNPCGTNICSCRKNGLKCVTACGDCRGEDCKNSEEIEDNDSIDEQNFYMHYCHSFIITKSGDI